MTDIIKRVEMKNSKDLLRHLKLHSGLVEQNIENFREELREGGFLHLFGAMGEEIVERDKEDNQDDPEADCLVARTHVLGAFHLSRRRYQ